MNDCVCETKTDLRSVYINGRVYNYEQDARLSYNDILKIGSRWMMIENPVYTVTYSYNYGKDASKMMSPGQSIYVSQGLVINVVWKKK